MFLCIYLDQAGFWGRWAALAVKHQLQGYHYLAPGAPQKALAPTAPAIPRYIRFDRTGRLVEATTARPSDGEKLHQQLREQLR